MKAARKQELISEINSILDANVLEPGHVGKLKGKLMFGAYQLWGEVGRAFLRIISERQYAKGFDPLRTADLGPALVAAVRQWIKLIQAGPPREITQVRPASSCVVLSQMGSHLTRGRRKLGPAGSGPLCSLGLRPGRHSSPQWSHMSSSPCGSQRSRRFV